MLRHLEKFAILAAGAAAFTSAQAADVAVSATITGQIVPGVYGRVDIGSMPRPPLLYTDPVIVLKPARPYVGEPLYLHVPPGHAKDWAKHCRHFDACGRPVYFVRSSEYGDDDGRGRGEGHGRGKGKGHDKHD